LVSDCILECIDNFSVESNFLLIIHNHNLLSVKWNFCNDLIFTVIKQIEDFLCKHNPTKPTEDLINLQPMRKIHLIARLTLFMLSLILSQLWDVNFMN
jgi:hypothetical protein